MPFVHESLFLHGSNVDCRLPDRLKERIFGREDAGANGLRGIVLDRLAMPPTRGAPVSQPQARALEGLLDTAGLRRPARSTQVGHWVVEDGGPLDAGWGWRDDLAHHRRYEGDQVRIRRWFVPPGTSRSDEAVLRRAADREYLTLRGLDHPGLLLPRDSIDVDGPVAALVYDHDPAAQDLGSWTAGLGSSRHARSAPRGAARAWPRCSATPTTTVSCTGPSAPTRCLVDGDDQVRLKDWQLAGRTGADASTSVTTHARDLLRHDDGIDPGLRGARGGARGGGRPPGGRRVLPRGARLPRAHR